MSSTIRTLSKKIVNIRLEIAQLMGFKITPNMRWNTMAKKLSERIQIIESVTRSL